ncbi:MAG: hypothetical protein H7343_22570 [Undibacterium sp.]|nr:hypothetical protein [Opitutaceae bacterium]
MGILLVVVAVGADRSFDFTDEGVYYLSAINPSDVPDRQTTYFYIGRALFAATGHSLLLTRVVIASLLLGSTLLFNRGATAFLTAFAPALKLGPWLGVATVAGTALAFSISPVAPSYNLFNAIFLLAATGLVLRASALPRSADRTDSLTLLGLLLAAALLVGLDFFVKFSTCAVLVGGLTLFFLLTSRASWLRKTLILLAAPAVGLIVGAGYFIFVERFAVWRAGIGGTLSGLSNGTYLRDELLRYVREIQTHVLETFWAYADVLTAVLVVGAILLCCRSRPRIQRGLAAAGFAIILGLFAISPLPAGSIHLNGVLGLRLHLGALVVLGVAVAATLLVRKSPSDRSFLAGAWRLLPLVPLFAVLPYAGAFGTTNNINTNTIYQFGPWLALIALATGILAHAWQAAWLMPLCLLPLIAITLFQSFTGYWLHPYRIPGGRPAQTEPTLIGAPAYASTLRLDPASHDFIAATRAQLTAHGFKPGDDIFAFYNLPGLVFALGGVSPGHPWYFSGDQRSLDLDAMRVSMVASARRTRAFVITNGDVTSFLPRLHAAGLDFPAAYHRCGESLKNPLTQETVEVWRPR